ncbi:AMP-binding protein [Fictibacillus phosphorivorans]|uniref:AMP-binding protein n=1 Tax=Fictibacillus phosphorivorans TaxID=1221500 RepID=UPI00203D484C|nr:AMP-binding protein [Fictibacillus phosphorivorans]MCM3775534.1 AMP-binding protein [Fictibacillus phosphorivorans]
MRITDTIQKNAALYPDKTAIQMGTENISYRELDKNIKKIASFFNKLPFEESQGKAALYLPNGIDFLQSFLGAISAGWIAIPLDLKWKERELNERLEQSQPDLILTTEVLQRRVNHKNATLTLVSAIADSVPFEENKNRVSDKSLFYMGFTSGSTGIPKCFVRSHRSWVKSFVCSKKDFGLTESDTVLVPGPLVHSLFLYAAISTIYLGGTVKLLPKFSAVRTLTEIETDEASVLYTVPTMLAGLTKEMNKPNNMLQLKKIISSGAKWEPGLKGRINRLFPKSELIEFYGASELSFVSFITHRADKQKALSVGRPFHNVELSIRKDGNEVERGEIGTLYVKSEMLFSHYLNRPDANKEVWENGWLTVGDLAKLDEDGDLYIIGRSNNMMISGGQNVYPEEIENVLHSLKGIEEAVVFGIPDPYWGEKVSAAILLNEHEELTTRDIQRICRKHLSIYKVPKHIIFKKKLPYTSSGKIARSKVKEMYGQGVFNS